MNLLISGRPSVSGVRRARGTDWRSTASLPRFERLDTRREPGRTSGGSRSPPRPTAFSDTPRRFPAFPFGEFCAASGNGLPEARTVARPLGTRPVPRHGNHPVKLHAELANRNIVPRQGNPGKEGAGTAGVRHSPVTGPGSVRERPLSSWPRGRNCFHGGTERPTDPRRPTGQTGPVPPPNPGRSPTPVIRFRRGAPFDVPGSRRPSPSCGCPRHSNVPAAASCPA